MDLYLIIDTRSSRVDSWRLDLEEAQQAATTLDSRKSAGQWQQHSSDEGRWVEYVSSWDGQSESAVLSPIEVHRLPGPVVPRTAPVAPSGSLLMELSVTIPSGARVSLSRTVPRGVLERGLAERLHLIEFGNTAAVTLAEQIERLSP